MSQRMAATSYSLGSSTQGTEETHSYYGGRVGDDQRVGLLSDCTGQTRDMIKAELLGKNKSSCMSRFKKSTCKVRSSNASRRKKLDNVTSVSRSLITSGPRGLDVSFHNDEREPNYSTRSAGDCRQGPAQSRGTSKHRSGRNSMITSDSPTPHRDSVINQTSEAPQPLAPLSIEIITPRANTQKSKTPKAFLQLDVKTPRGSVRKDGPAFVPGAAVSKNGVTPRATPKHGGLRKGQGKGKTRASVSFPDGGPYKSTNIVKNPNVKTESSSETRGVFRIDPKILHFTSETIGDDFHDTQSIFNTISKLRSNKLSASDLPRMCVYLCPRNHAWFTIHNSLLYCFQQAGISSVEVCEMDKSKVLNRTVPRQKQIEALKCPNPAPEKSASTGDEGCWIFVPKYVGRDTKWSFSFYNDLVKWDSCYEYPRNTKFVRDGIGGVWALCSTEGGGANWNLWHISPSQEINTGFDYPAGCKIVSDGKGGIWILSATAGFSQWKLWHITLSPKRRERQLYDYPRESTMTSDGNGGVWILCPTAGESQWQLWHANENGEKRLYSYPRNSRMVGDGQGGVWILARAEKMWMLWHADSNSEEQLFTYPDTSRLYGDNHGGVWIFCPTDRKTWHLWHATRNEEQRCYEYPQDSAIVSENSGGVWILSPPDGSPSESEWSLSHTNQQDAKVVHKVPIFSQMVTNECGAS